MTVTRRIFDAEKRYEFGKMQHLKELFHWDVNETQDEQLYKMSRIVQSAIGDNVLLEDAMFLGGVSFELQASMPATSFGFMPGIAIINGRWCDAGNSLSVVDYDDDTNIVAKCVVRNIIEDSPSTLYTIEMYGNAGFEDFIGALQDQISSANIRIQFTSGVEDGNTFEVASSTLSTDTTFIISDDLSGVVDGDTFVVRPPAIVPNLSSQVDEIYLCNIYQELDENCDVDLEDPTLNVTPTKRFASRTFITLNPDYGALTGDAMTGIVYMKLGEFERLSPGADINPVRTAIWLSPSTSMINYAVEGIEALLLEKDIQDSAQNPIIVEAAIGGTGVTLHDGRHIINANGSSGLWVETLEELKITLTNTDNDNVILSAGAGNYVDVTQTPATTTQLSLQDKYVVKAAVSAQDILGTQIVQDVFEMGHNDSFRGFDWRVGDYLGSGDTLIIGPGETFRRGMMIQSPRQLSIDTSSSANWIEGSVQTGWNYIYMYKDGRTCTPFLSASRPTINGLFADVSTLNTAYTVQTAFCIGMFHKNSTTTTTPCVCKNGTIYFTHLEGGISPPTRFALVSSLVVSNYVLNVNNNSWNSSSLPTGVYEYEICVEFESVGCTSTGYLLFDVHDLASGECQVRKRVFVPHSYTAASYFVTLPMMRGRYNVTMSGTVGHWTVTNGAVVLSSMKFNPLYFNPSYRDWIAQLSHAT